MTSASFFFVTLAIVYTELMTNQTNMQEYNVSQCLRASYTLIIYHIKCQTLIQDLPAKLFHLRHSNCQKTFIFLKLF